MSEDGRGEKFDCIPIISDYDPVWRFNIKYRLINIKYRDVFNNQSKKNLAPENFLGFWGAFHIIMSKSFGKLVYQGVCSTLFFLLFWF